MGSVTLTLTLILAVIPTRTRSRAQALTLTLTRAEPERRRVRRRRRGAAGDGAGRAVGWLRAAERVALGRLGGGLQEDGALGGGHRRAQQLLDLVRVRVKGEG